MDRGMPIRSRLPAVHAASTSDTAIGPPRPQARPGLPEGRVGAAYAEQSLVFAQPNGDPIHPERLTKRFGRLVKTSGLRGNRLHDLQHARASLLLASGTDISLVSKLLGHSSISVTADTYAHLLEGVGRRAARRPTRWFPGSGVTNR
jgi:integrase